MTSPGSTQQCPQSSARGCYVGRSQHGIASRPQRPALHAVARQGCLTSLRGRRGLTGQLPRREAAFIKGFGVRRQQVGRRERRLMQVACLDMARAGPNREGGHCKKLREKRGSAAGGEPRRGRRAVGEKGGGRGSIRAHPPDKGPRELLASASGASRGWVFRCSTGSGYISTAVPPSSNDGRWTLHQTRGGIGRSLWIRPNAKGASKLGLGSALRRPHQARRAPRLPPRVATYLSEGGAPSGCVPPSIRQIQLKSGRCWPFSGPTRPPTAPASPDPKRARSKRA